MANHIAVYVEYQQLDALYAEDNNMNIDIDEYPYRGLIIVPRGDSARVRFSVYDEDGNPFDVSAAIEIEFIVAADTSSPVIYTRKLSGGAITASGNTLTVFISSDLSKLPMNNKNYFELAVQLTSTQRRTVASGVYRATDTVLGL